MPHQMPHPVCPLKSPILELFNAQKTNAKASKLISTTFNIFSRTKIVVFCMVRTSDGAPKSSAPLLFSKKTSRALQKKSSGRSNYPIELIFDSRESSRPTYSFCPTQMGGEAKGEAKYRIENQNNRNK